MNKQVGDQYVRKAKRLVANQGLKLMIGREWLTTLKLEIVPKRQQKGELYVNSIEKGEGEKKRGN